MAIGKEIFNRINRIDWFYNCGNRVKDVLGFEIVYVNSWQEASNYINQPLWEDTTMEARNELTSFLCNKYRNEYSKWNIITKEAKKFLEKEIVPRVNIVKEKNSLDDVIVDCVKWDLLGSIMEDAYKECINRPTFFLNILAVYEGGNFPCGWEGNWPQGKLIVF